MFQQVGSKAYKEGLENTLALDAHFGHPHTRYKTIHVGGTNGKGSCSHTLAAVLQSAGYKVGLYTSPHLVDFRERIRINGSPIPEEVVVDFVARHRAFFEPLHPSFFEVTTALAFLWFAQEGVDVAVIEVGLGGRLDCTNIITPTLSIITNISPDHTALLGNSLAEIATEKAGIIKPCVPVVVGETTAQTRSIFARKAEEAGAPITFAEDEKLLLATTFEPDGTPLHQTRRYPNLRAGLRGIYQIKNTNTLLSAIARLIEAGYNITEEAVRHGFEHVTTLTGLQGRWQTLQTAPTVVCDTGHNVAGITDVMKQLEMQTYRRLHIVFGMVNDKDVSGVLALLPTHACYYFTRPSNERALPQDQLREAAQAFGLQGNAYADVVSALTAAQEKSLPEDFIFIGGSSFMVADVLSHRDALNFH